jgi:hypothetical protein
MVDVACKTCTFQGENLVDMGAEPPVALCPECGETAIVMQTIGSPAVLQASYPDGKKRFTEEKAWSKLNVERGNRDWRDPERKRIEKEMAEIKKVGKV